MCRGCLLVRGVPKLHVALKPVRQTMTFFSTSSFDCNFGRSNNQTFNVYTKSTLSIYRKGLCTFFQFLNSPRKIFNVERSVAIISDQREYIIRTFLSVDIYRSSMIFHKWTKNVLAGAVVRWGNSTKNNSSYSPDPIFRISATIIRTFLSVDIYMMKVACMFTFL